MRLNLVIVAAASIGMSNALRRQCIDEKYTTIEIDTVQKIADDFCTQASDIRQLNNLGPNQEFKAGTNINTPCPKRTRDCQKNPSGNGAYVVVKGDTFTQIAPDFCTNVTVLIDLNPQIQDPNLIFPNQVLWVPCHFNDVPPPPGPHH